MLYSIRLALIASQLRVGSSRFQLLAGSSEADARRYASEVAMKSSSA
jgi:hypothetical protein